MEIAARFDLELIQYKVVNAFVNADLNQEVYIKMPPGYRKPGMILLLRKALYRLRKDLPLWQQHFIRTLTNMTFHTIPHEPCCMIRNGILIFYYVDDIVIAFRKDQTAEAKGVADLLGLSYITSPEGETSSGSWELKSYETAAEGLFGCHRLHISIRSLDWLRSQVDQTQGRQCGIKNYSHTRATQLINQSITTRRR
jgi:hypothetical protein